MCGRTVRSIPGIRPYNPPRRRHCGALCATLRPVPPALYVASLPAPRSASVSDSVSVPLALSVTANVSVSLYMYAYVYMYISMYVCIYACIYVSIHVHKYIYMMTRITRSVHGCQRARVPGREATGPNRPAFTGRRKRHLLEPQDPADEDAQRETFRVSN